jgi:hypothetical protein
MRSTPLENGWLYSRSCERQIRDDGRQSRVVTFIEARRIRDALPFPYSGDVEKALLAAIQGKIDRETVTLMLNGDLADNFNAIPAPIPEDKGAGWGDW